MNGERFVVSGRGTVHGEKIGGVYIHIYIHIFLMAGNRGISPGVYEIPARRRLAKFIIPPSLLSPSLPP